ncbi:Putative L-Aspartase [Colletotrichum destructivum]|uniref:L-Aspartase n=1 Tax=Colletotrichum destructivum TaxID=34406 RepID=A0AAX4IAT1_9PEZI|nr:Putative L-Aspartase [Colletotrichum destructivum]
MKARLKVTGEDFEVVRVEEKCSRHLSLEQHIHAFDVAAPATVGIMHYGAATSSFSPTIPESILVRDVLEPLIKKTTKVYIQLLLFGTQVEGWVLETSIAGTILSDSTLDAHRTPAGCYPAEPNLAHKHLQVTQLITAGKQAVKWAQDAMLDLRSMEQVRSELKFCGARGTTGTQASFLGIFQGDSTECDAQASRFRRPLHRPMGTDLPKMRLLADAVFIDLDKCD